MKLKVGARYHSQVCPTQVIVVKAPDEDADLRCGGTPMSNEPGPLTGTAAPGFDTGTRLGKRYSDDSTEVLVVSPGSGALSIGSDLLDVKAAKQLPSSD